MKLVNQLLAVSTLTLAVAPAFAQTQSADLFVHGVIKTPACTLTLGAGGGVVDFGDIHRGDLKPTTTTAIGSQKVEMNVLCDAKTIVALKIEDNKPTAKPAGNMLFSFKNLGTPAEVNRTGTAVFGLTNSLNATNIGGYAMRMGEVKVDEADARVWSAVGLEAGWADRTPLVDAVEGDGRYFKAMTTGNGVLIGESFTFPIDVALSIVPSSDVPATDDISLEGTTTIEVYQL